MTFDLKQIKSTKREMPVRTLLYGQHKLGKSTFASNAPNPIFIQTEDGLDSIKANAFPLCQSWQDVLDCITSLYQNKHDYQTVVLDSCDWAEKLAHTAVAKDNNVTGIESIGYGKGYSFACDKFSEALEGLNALRIERGMSVVLVCHAEVKTFNDPMTDSYDRWQIKLHKSVGKLLLEWCDVIGFAQLDTVTKIEKAKGFKDERVRAVDTGRRVLRLVGSAAYEAGNRYGLPETLPLDWAAYQAALDAARKDDGK